MGDDSGGGVPGGRRAAAFFDLDKTVLAASSTLAFGPGLYREGLLSPTGMLRAAYAQLTYERLGASAQRIERGRVALLRTMRGWEAARIRRLVSESLTEVLDPLIYREALDLFGEHRAAGRELWLVSTSGAEIVEPLAEYLGVANVLATRAGVDDDGRYDGTLDFFCFGRAKAAAVAAVAVERGLDLPCSYAYSDSITDVWMLEAVGHPVAVNPDRELRVLAARRGWEIRDFVRPVALRSRRHALPQPSPQVVTGVRAAGTALLAGAVLYRGRGPVADLLRRATTRRRPHQEKRSRSARTLSM